MHMSRPQSPGIKGPDLPQIGFIVPKSVGSAVIRNRVKRRLRHLSRPRLDSLPRGSAVVLRALPPAATASYQELGADLDQGLRRVRRTCDDGSSAVSS